VSDNDLNSRLTFATVSLLHLLPDAIPSEHNEEFQVLKTLLTRTPLSNETTYLPRDLTEEEAREAATKILGMFTDVMGGL